MSKKIYMKEYMKNYYINNQAKYKTVINCDICPGNYTFSRKTQHYKSQKHKYYEMKKAMDDNKDILIKIEKDNDDLRRLVIDDSESLDLNPSID